MICGNFLVEISFFLYCSSSWLIEFFYDCDIDYVYDGLICNYWVVEILWFIFVEL